MKKIKTTIILLSLIVNSLLSQNKNAGVAFLYEMKPEVTFYGMNPPRSSDVPKIYYQHGNGFSSKRLFDTLTTKIASILPQMGLRLIIEDSIINTENYKALVVKNKSEITPNYIIKEGYAFPANFALLFKNDGNDPSVMIEVYADFELNNSTDMSLSGNGKMLTDINLSLTVVGYDSKKKKVFSFKTKNKPYKTTDFRVALKQSSTSNWGYEIAEDITNKEILCIIDAFKQIDEDLPKQIEKVSKFYSK
jgi:hypothetical protein